MDRDRASKRCKWCFVYDTTLGTELMELRTLKRRAGVAEEQVRIKKQLLEETEQEYEEEHRTFTCFSKRYPTRSLWRSTHSHKQGTSPQHNSSYRYRPYNSRTT